MNRNDYASDVFMTESAARPAVTKGVESPDQKLAKSLIDAGVELMKLGRVNDAKIVQGMASTLVEKIKHDREGHIALDRKAADCGTTAAAWEKASDQPVQKNLATAHQSVGDMTGVEAAQDYMSKKAVCHRHCQKTWGRPRCPHCYGQGFEKGDQMRIKASQGVFVEDAV